ncbi:MAG: prepilin-type N-terminal cleavage/methylation domain-containing protein [Candidatus Omnitrophica bacterium]|nr:prepilin-type N-terminal cleavage/methylation domain-containing protein [Candidatus Omnitrophota bacterium]MDD5429971.1 prepilin-type N-terminal cleavage/methylation domain-containing protein [Candidatus Omnitrophota bacterium]
MKKGFTLVEIMIVVAIIALLAAIAIPNLLRARVSAQEAAAAAALHTIAAAEVQYRATHSAYAALANLDDDDPPYVDSTLAAGAKQGYNFTATPVSGSTGSQFIATAAPQTLSQAHTFYIDEDGVLCRSNSTNTSAPTTHTGSGCPTGFAEVE